MSRAQAESKSRALVNVKRPNHLAQTSPLSEMLRV